MSVQQVLRIESSAVSNKPLPKRRYQAPYSHIDLYKSHVVMEALLSKSKDCHFVSITNYLSYLWILNVLLFSNHIFHSYIVNLPNKIAEESCSKPQHFSPNESLFSHHQATCKPIYWYQEKADHTRRTINNWQAEEQVCMYMYVLNRKHC